MKIKDITDYLETIAPLPYQESYDNSGLIVGNSNTAVKKVLITLDVTEAVVDEAIRDKCQLIIAHHPIVFGGLKKLNGKNYVERVVIKAIKNNIAIYAIHTNYDNVIEGVNAKICERLGLVDCEILVPKKQLLKIAGLRCKHFNKSAIIVIVMNKLVLNAVETNMYIPKESIKFIRNKQNKMESEFFRINNIKNPEINNRAVDSDTDAVLGTSDNDSNSDVDSSDGDTEVKTT